MGYFQSVSPLRTQDAFTCNVTRLPLFLTSIAAGLEESGYGGSWGSWQWPDVWHSLFAPPLCAFKIALSHLLDPPTTGPTTPKRSTRHASGCCSNQWQRNKLIRRCTELITRAPKCCWRFLFGARLRTISSRLKAKVACKTVWFSFTPLPDADSLWHPTDSWNGWGPPDFWGL